jgi:dTDP-4-amino-4,6-dideoxygalactose transaminase
MFDAAHAVGGTFRGRKIGNFGLAEVFSFHATKVMNAFEGGMVTTNDDDLAKKIRLMNNFGFTGMDRVEYIGTNGKMNEVSAAMGLTSLESLPEFVAANRRNHEAYRAGLQGIPGIRFLEYNAEEKNPHHYVVIEIDEAVFGLSRDELMAVLHAERIRARRYFYPGCHRMEPYASMDVNPVLPATEELCDKVLCLPTGTQVGTAEIEKICEVCRLAVQSAAAIKGCSKICPSTFSVSIPLIEKANR